MKLLIGGSPCTHWSIAQTKNRETEASGIGWELFLNYRIARDKYQPDFFLYENNKSMAPAIKAQISKELGVEPVLINSALVSAQNRQRLYWVGKRNPDGTYSQVPVEQPEDRGILLRDILETGFPLREKGYALQTGHSATAEDAIARRQRNAVAEPVAIKPLTEKGYALDPAHAEVLNVNPSGHGMNGAVMHCDGKSRTLTTNKGEGPKIITPIRIGTIENDGKNQDHDSQQYRVYSPDGKSVTLCGQGGGVGAKTGLYAVPVIPDGKGQFVIKAAGGKEIPVYEVRDGKICVMVNQKGETERVEKWFPIKLADGFYIIRKLTVRECMRLQTVPEEYVFPVSATQAYKMLGNGWTVDVIAHIMSHFTGLTAEPVEVLSMYDGMSCGHIALDKLGAEITAYYATEIDKYAIQTTQHNYPDTVQLGDAFQVRDNNWRLWEEL